VGANDLRRIVLEQAMWVGGGGLAIALVVGTALLAAASWADVPVAMDLRGATLVGLMVLGVALGSGLAAMRSLRHADPIALLR
jgi:putative ABC transport system permease protein